MTPDDEKKLKEQFNQAAAEPELEVVFESDFDDTLDQSPEQDQDEKLRGNTDPKHDPKNVPNRGYTPSGTSPNFGSNQSSDQGQQQNQPSAPEVQTGSKEWQERLRNGNHSVEDEFNGLRVRTWIANEPSDKNIHKGHLQEIIVTKGEYGKENRLAHFREGEWEKSPETTPERQAIQEVVEKYDGEFLSKQRQQKQEREPDRDRGNSR